MSSRVGTSRTAAIPSGQNGAGRGTLLSRTELGRVGNEHGRNNSRRILIALSIGLVSIAHLMPTAIGILLTLLGLAGGFVLWTSGGDTERRGYWPVVFAGAIIAFWAIGFINTNVPSAEIGVEGFRKSAFAVAGIAWGCSIGSDDRVWVERSIIVILNALMALSIVSFIWFPNLLNISTDAVVYTSMFDDQERLQGAFSGPFHVAMAGLVLIGWAIVRYRSNRTIAVISLFLGAVGGYMSLVRTFYPALALMLVVFVIVSPSLWVAMRRAFALASVGAVLLFVVLLFPNLSRLGDIASTIVDFDTDDRFTHRFRRYATSLDLFQTSPVYGWGPGSAGDTLQFPTGYQHVNAHNAVLKVLVEGGFVGLLLWVALVVSIFVCCTRTNPQTQIAALALSALFGIGLTVSAIDALPVSFLIFVLCGLACERSKSSGKFASHRHADQAATSFLDDLPRGRGHNGEGKQLGSLGGGKSLSRR